jgi:hypothetical protein
MVYLYVDVTEVHLTSCLRFDLRVFERLKFVELNCVIGLLLSRGMRHISIFIFKWLQVCFHALTNIAHNVPTVG